MEWALTLPITSFYASVLTALYIALFVRVVQHRHSKGIAIGNGNDNSFTYIVRVRTHPFTRTPPGRAFSAGPCQFPGIRSAVSDPVGSLRDARCIAVWRAARFGRRLYRRQGTPCVSLLLARSLSRSTARNGGDGRRPRHRISCPDQTRPVIDTTSPVSALPLVRPFVSSVFARIARKVPDLDCIREGRPANA